MVPSLSWLLAVRAGSSRTSEGRSLWATLWAFPSWIRDGIVSGLLICHDHRLWSRGSRTGQERTEFKRKLVLHLYDSIKGCGGNSDSCIGLS